ncbi:hypothetical protein MY4038_010225 [Beauveria bassiana]
MEFLNISEDVNWMTKGLSVQDGSHAVSAFAVTASLGYVEALRSMVRAIADHVGGYGRDATRWPLQEIGDGQGAPLMNKKQHVKHED